MNVILLHRGSLNNAKTLFDFLVALRVFVAIEQPRLPPCEPPSESTLYMSPFTFKGWPAFWREIIDETPLRLPWNATCVRGLRYSCVDSIITVSAFVRAMAHLCLQPNRMWGCAFAKSLENGTFLFVRLSESRDSVDVVVLGCDVSLLHGDFVDRALLRVSQLLHTDQSTMMQLCPKCCASDMFVRCGIAHAFYIRQAVAPDTGRALRCSRMHDVSAVAVRDGLRVGKVGDNFESVIYPSNSDLRNDLPWESVTATGLARLPGGGGEVLPGSFFLLTHQLQEGCILSPECVTVVDAAVASGAMTCRVTVRGGDFELQLKFCVGHFIGRRDGAVIGGRTIRSIIACTAVEIESVEVSSGIVTVSENELFNPATGDEVMLLVSNDYNGKPTDGVACRVADVVAPRRFRLVRCHATDGPLPRLVGVTLMPLVRSFTVSDHVVVLYEPIPSSRGQEAWQPPLDIFPGSNGQHTQMIRLSPGNYSSSSATETCWREVKDHWSIMMGCEIKNFDITGMTIFRNPVRERLFLEEANELKRLAKLRGPLLQLQQRTMRHFRDFTQKFGLLPAAENVDVNVSVAWLNKGKRFYFNFAQNGVLKLPRFLKCDAEMSHDGLKFTRYPIYSDYYSSGFSLSDRMVEQSDMLLCCTLLGRPQADVNMSTPSGIRSSGCPDSCYTNLKRDLLTQTFVQCPLRKQPDYDEISMFKPQRILPAAYLTFQRRRKTLLWLDSKPDAPDNIAILHAIPGYRFSKPEAAAAPGTFSLTTNVQGVPADLQVDVFLFSTVAAAVAFLTQPQYVKFTEYPQSLFRIVSSRQLYVGAQGLCAALEGQSAWEFAFPATMVFHGRCEDGLRELSSRPNLRVSQRIDDCVAFATFDVDISAVIGTGVSASSVGEPAVQGGTPDFSSSAATFTTFGT